MKKLIVFLFFLGMTSIAIGQQQPANEALRLSKPVETGENYEVFGAKYPEEVQEKKLSDLVAESNKYKGKEVSTEGMIKQVCQKKGCFFILVDGENEARITFKDYKFFIPTDAAGKKVQLQGYFRVKKLSEKQAKHYAEDAGEDAEKVEGPKKEFNIVASSVKITDPKGS